MYNEDIPKIYQQVIEAQLRHTKFLNATEKNLSYYYFGKSVSIIKRAVFPEIDILDALSTYTPEAYNPMAYLISAFIDEIANTPLKTNVTPWPLAGKEPYESFADYLENYLTEIHRQSNRKKNLRGLVFELLNHGYFGIYTDGFKCYYLTAYDLIPGDAAITEKEDQPLWIRKTRIRKSTLANIPGVDLDKEIHSGFSLIPDLDYIGLYDVWIKPLDLNICLTEGGQKVYSQPFPYPKKYPFFIANDSELLNAFYPVPLMQKLGSLLGKYQDSVESKEESSKSIAKPLLVYDADSGIDINMVQRALKEGYKHIIIGKNREGDIDFKSPGHLPGYAVKMPEDIINQMMKHLGLTESFLGMPAAGVRERGALSRLIKASFRKIASKASLIEEAFSDLDMYLIEYLRAHKLKAADKFKFKNIEEIFTSDMHYIPRENFYGFSSDDTYENRMFTLSKWKTKLIPQEQALKDLGHTQPKKIIEKVKQEAKDNQEFAMSLKKIGEEAKPQSILDKAWEKLKGKLENRFFLTPVADDKVLVQCHFSEVERVGFILGDLTQSILIEAIEKKIPPTKEQKEIEVKEPEPLPSPVPEKPVEEKPIEGKPIVPSEQMKEETRGRPSTSLKEPKEIVEKIAKTPEPAGVEAPIEGTASFSEEALQNLIRLSKTIPFHQIRKYLALPGMFIVEPHAKWISMGKKLLLLKAKKFDIVDKPHLLCGKEKVYGVIIVRKIIEDFDFRALQKYHLISDREKAKWWKGNKLYLYMFEFHPFAKTLDYDKAEGVQTFIKEVKIKPESIGVPYRGDLKPIGLQPSKIPPPHKPEKKAFQPHEVFSLERLQKIIPEASYDVSFKVDGLRAFVWVKDGKAAMYSDEGRKWPESRIKSILEEAERKFKHDVLLDGELIMKGIRRKDVAGYIHAKSQPTPEQLENLRYIVWDILYVKDKSIASLPFSKRSAVLDLYLLFKPSQKGKIQRVAHGLAKNRKAVMPLAKKLMSNEGVVIRDINASYWATHSTYKMKKMFDVDAKVFAVAKTKVGLPIFFCELRDGTYIGSTYAQSEVSAKPGEVIRVNIDHVSILPSGRINWYGPKPRSWKNGKVTPKRTSTTQVGIGGADTLALIKEIYLVTGGTEEKWDEWEPKFDEWRKTKMLLFKLQIKKKIKEGIPVAGIVS